jgi:hypothetical protein
MKSTILRLFTITLVALVLLALGWLWLTLHWNYSEGERAGYVQKLSKKGWLCKTWEGEIAMVTMPGAIPEKFEFTVRDEVVSSKINALSGKRVVLYYRQHKFIPTSCFGETEYFIEDVREVLETQPPQTLQPPLAPSAAQGQLQPPR